jgi:hypothetical protein
MTKYAAARPADTRTTFATARALASVIQLRRVVPDDVVPELPPVDGEWVPPLEPLVDP